MKLVLVVLLILCAKAFAAPERDPLEWWGSQDASFSVYVMDCGESTTLLDYYELFEIESNYQYDIVGETEEEIIEKWLIQQDVKVHKLPFDKNYFVEGGEFYFCPKENILFAGTGRNNTIGNTKTAELLKVDELVELSTEAFHLDTVFTPVLNKQNELCLVIVCTQLLEYESLQRLQTFTKTKGIQLLDIPPEETIGLGTQLGSFAANCLPLPGILLGSSAFVSESVNLALAEHNITHSIVPLTQFRLSGGSVHCLTNEL